MKLGNEATENKELAGVRSLWDIAKARGMTPAWLDPPEVWATLWEGFGEGDSHLAYDIGANCGQTLEQELSLYGHVMAFEPAHESFAVLKEYVSHHRERDRITVNQMAISAHCGEIGLLMLPDKMKFGELVSEWAAGMEYDPLKATELRIVNCLTVDHIVQESGAVPAFIKVDVEGHEWEVLRGATATINVNRPDMLIEVHSEILGRTIRQFLRDLHYAVEIVRHPHYAVGTPLYKAHFWIKAFSS